MSSRLTRQHHCIFLPKMKEIWKTNSRLSGAVHCTPSAVCFLSGLKTAWCRGQSSDVYIKFDCCLEYSSGFVEFHRTISWLWTAGRTFTFRLIVKRHLRLVAIAFKDGFIFLRKKVTFLQFSELCLCYSCCCETLSDKILKVAYTVLGILLL